MAQTLYLVRHTKPDIAPGICYGQLDPGVAGSFELEAQQVLAWLPPAELILTSPLQRTCRLAEYLAQALKSDLWADARLMEKHFGLWEGKAWNDIARSEIEAWAVDVTGYAPPGGESGKQVMLRAQALLRDAALLPNENVIMVTHGGMVRAMLAQLGHLPLADTLRWEVDYGTVIAVRF